MKYYVRATGANRFAGGTDKWLRIKDIKKETYAYIIEVSIRGQRKFVAIKKDTPTENLEFAMGWPGLQPVSYRTVIAAFMR